MRGAAATLGSDLSEAHTIARAPSCQPDSFFGHTLVGHILGLHRLVYHALGCGYAKRGRSGGPRVWQAQHA